MCIKRSILITILFFLLIGISSEVANAQLAGYSDRIKLRVNASEVQGTSDLTNFPVLVSGTFSELVGVARTDGFDIAFTAANGTTILSHQLESYNSGTGAMEFWVRFPTLSESVDTEFYIYFGNASITTDQSSTNVWDSNYKMVLHLDETVAGPTTFTDAAGELLSSDITDNATTATTGQIGGARLFTDPGTGDLITIADNGVSPLDISGNITISLWVQITNLTSGPDILSKGTYTDGYGIWVNGSGSLRFQINNTSLNSATGAIQQDGNWDHIAFTRASNGDRIIYANGEQIAADNNIASFTVDDDDLFLSTAAFDYEGGMDEVRLSNITRDSAWIATEYINQATPGTFLTQINAEPILDDIEAGTITFNSGDSPTIITSTLTVADGDDTNIESATIAITSNFDSSEDVLAFVDQLGISGSYASGTGILTLSGTSSIANYQTAIRSITYQNTAISPSELTRTISFTINDGTDDSNTETRDIDIVKVNVAPVLSSIESGSIIYFEGNGTKLLTSSILASDADDTNIESATVSITTGLTTSEDVLAFVDANGITGSYASGTGILSLSGSASLAAYQSALRSVTYENTGSPLDMTTRTIEFTINDGTENSNTLSRDIEFPDEVTELASYKATGVFHYDAQDADGNGDPGTGQPANGALSPWSDRSDNVGASGADISASNGTGTDQPLLNSNYFGERGALFFDGTDDNLSPTNNTLLNTGTYTEKSFAMVFRTGDSTTGLQVMFEQGGGTRGYQFSIKDDNLYAFVWNNNEWGGGDQYKSIDLGNVQPNTSYILIANHDATAGALVDKVWEANVNGGAISSLANVDFQRAHSGGAEIGEEDGTRDPVTTGNNPAGTNNFGGFIAEFVSWNNALTANDFSTIYSFLSDKWFNTPSVLSDIEVAPLTYNESDPATSVTSTITITDEDNTLLDSAKVYFSSGYLSAEDILAFSNTAEITGSYDTPGGILTLFGTTSISNYRTALRNVTYQNTGSGASITEGTRELSFIVYDWDDSSSVVTREVDVIPANDVPALANLEASLLAYTEGDGATIISSPSLITVTDTDNTNLQGATISFTNNYFLGEDILNYVDGNGITGSFDAMTGVLTLSGTTLVSNYQTALRTVTYENTSSDPVTGLNRTVEFTVTDGIDTSPGVSRDISVTNLNTAPTLDNIEPGNLFYPVGDSVVVSETITISDPDDTNIESVIFDIGPNYDNTQDTLIFQTVFGITGAWNDVNGTLTLSNSASKADYQAAIRTVKYASTNNTPEDLPRTISITANDGDASSAVVSRTVSFSIPKSVSDLLVWLKGDAGTFDATTGGSASTDGGIVRRWEDQSGNGNDFITADTAPLFQTSEATINSQNAIEFDGTSGVRLEDDDAENYLNVLDELTIFFVIESDITGTDHGFWTTTTPSGTDDVFTIRYDALGDNGSGVNVIKTGMRDLSVAFAQESFEDAQTTAGQIVMLKWTSEQNYELYVDGVLSNPTFLQNIPTGVLTSVTTAIIGQGEQDATASWDGLIAEVILYGKEVSITEQEDIEDYLSIKYGIAIRSLTAATGGEAISADDASIAPSPAYTTLTGPRVQENFVGEFTSGGTFVFNAPAGFEWDDTNSPAPSASVSSAFGGGTELAIGFTSRTTSQIIFTVSAPSFDDNNVDGQDDDNPGEIIFSDFRVRPTTGTLPNTGNITNSGTTGLGGSTNYGVLTMVAGNQIEMEFDQQPSVSNIGSAISPTVRVQLIDQFGNPVQQDRVEIGLSLNQVSGTGVLAGTTPVQTNLFGIAEFSDISVGTVPGDAGTYSLTASAASLPGADTTSTEFDVVVLGQLTQFVVERVPSGNISDKLAGQSFNITIVAVDGAQDTVDTFTGTISLTSNCTIGTGGGTSPSFVGGVLASQTVSVTNLGTCTLTATNSSGSETGDSNAFDVTPGAASATTTTISSSPSVILNDGFSTSTITVQLKDSEGNNRTIGGETVVLSTTDGVLGSVTDNGDGTYTAILTSSVVAGTATITGTLDAVAITDNTEVEFAEFNNLWQSSVGSVADARNWDLATNWSAGTVPVPADKVLIPANPGVGNEQPVINTTDTQIAQLSIETSASVTVSGGKELIITGELSGGGEVIGSNTDSVTVGGDLAISDVSVGYVKLDGTVNQDVTTPNDYVNLELDNTNGADFFSNLVVSDSLKLTNGTLFMPSGTNLIANAKEYGNGFIRMQRRLSGNQGWRIISSPIDTTYGEFLDGVLTQGYAGAFYDISSSPGDTVQPNVLTYLESFEGTDNQRYRAPTGSTQRVTEGQGMFVFLFGDIAADSRYNDPLPDTLDVIGREFEGDKTEVDFGITYTMAADTGWNLVGNPFLATIDWDDEANWTKTNVESTIYIWDPASNGGDGEYLTWNGVTGTLPTGGLIAPFQGFWVKANAASPELKVNLDAKTTSGGFLGKAAAGESVSDSTKTKQAEPDNPIIEIAVTSSDGREKKTNIMFSEEGKKGKDALDAYRLLPLSTSHVEFHTLLEDGTEFAINNLPIDFNSRNFIPLHMDAFENGAPASGEFEVVWGDLRTIPEDWILTLIDNDTGTEVNMLEEVSYTFNHSTTAKISTNNSSNPLTPNYSIRQKAKTQATRFTLKVSTEQIERDVPEEIFLSQNYPNPFNPSTLIPFGINEDSNVELVVYDILGRKVRTLISGPQLAGKYEIRFNSRELASGVYFYRLVTNNKTLTKKFTLIK